MSLLTWFTLNFLIAPPARPCQRCVKRGFANNCTEGHRKKAKYLLDEEELGTVIILLLRRPIHFDHVL